MKKKKQQMLVINTSQTSQVETGSVVDQLLDCMKGLAGEMEMPVVYLEEPENKEVCQLRQLPAEKLPATNKERLK